MDRVFELTVLIILILAVVLAYFQTSKLDINHHPMSKLDDVLLFIAIPAFFSETIFSLVPAVVNGSYLNMAIILAQVFVFTYFHSINNNCIIKYFKDYSSFNSNTMDLRCITTLLKFRRTEKKEAWTRTCNISYNCQCITLDFLHIFC